MIKKAPIRFIPYFKSVIWGGRKICTYKGIGQQEPNIGESWEISEVPGYESRVADGPYKGMTITELIGRFGADLLGLDVLNRYDGKFPLLVKLIDANDKLSVQVHPNDDLARKRHNSLGKTEMWYIIDAAPGAKIYSGLNRDLTPDEYVDRIKEKSIEDVLAVHDSKPGDVFFLPAGRVHAIGAGNLLAEIQESSDITYRIYDYDRRDASGNVRDLHTEQAMEAIDYSFHSDYKSTPSDLGNPDLELALCDHFKVNRILLDGNMQFEFPATSFTILMCIKGEATIGDSNTWESLKEGETLLLPAVMNSFELKGNGMLLVVRS